MAIVRHIKTDIPYRYLGNDRYRNLITSIEGEVTPEVALKIFALNLDATELCNEYPNVEKLIAGLNLKLERR